MKHIFDVALSKKLIAGGMLGIAWMLWVFIPAYSPSLGTFFFLPPLVLISLFVWAGFVMFSLYCLVSMIVLFKKSAKEAVLPFALCLACFLAGNVLETYGANVRLDMFRHNLTAFDQQVDLIEKQLLANEGTEKAVYGFHMLDDFTVEELGDPFNVVAYYETNGVLTLRFLHAVSMQAHHRGYLYRSDGQLDSAIAEGEWMEAVINSNWCTVGSSIDLGATPE